MAAHIQRDTAMTGTSNRESAVDRIRERVEEKAARRAAAKSGAAKSGAAKGGAAKTAAAKTGAAKTAAAKTGAANGSADPQQAPPGAPSEQELPGIHAEKPTEIPLRGWKQIVKRAWAENKADNMPIIAGGVAFFGFLAIFPALIALISIYGLIASPESVAKQVGDLSKQLPQDASSLIGDQLKSITENAGGALTIGLVISILAALWSASGGVSNMITAINLAYDEVETRNTVRLRLLSLGLTLGGILFFLITIGLVAVVPALLDALPLGVVGT